MSGPTEARPLQVRIADDLRARIESGDLEPGAMLPTVAELTDEYGCSTAPARRAMALLREQGLITTGRGTAARVRQYKMLTHVATSALRPDHPVSSDDDFVEQVNNAARSPRKTFELTITTPPRDIATRLGIPGDELTVIRSLVQYVDEEPWMQEVSWYPRDLAQQVGLDTPHDIPEGTLRALRNAGHAEVSWRDEVLSRAPTPAEAQLLEVSAGVPLSIQTRTAATGQRVTRVTRWYRPGDRVNLVYELGDDAGMAVIASAASSGNTKEDQ